MDIDYPLAWFDDLIMVTLNQRQDDIVQVGQFHCEQTMERADLECLKIKTQLKGQVFTTSSQEEIEIVVRQYHSSLIMLHDYALSENHLVFTNKHLESTLKHVLSKIDELISFIESRFLKFLNQEDQVPQSHFSHTQAEIREKLPFLKEKLDKLPLAPELIDIIINRLHRFSSDEKQIFSVTFKNILYKKELVKNLCELDIESPTELEYTALDRLLIYLNYNSKTYIRNLRSRITKGINQAVTVPDKIDQLSLSFKVFNQILRRSEVILNPMFPDIHQVMSNWFTEEIAYLERKMHLLVNVPNGKSTENVPSSEASASNSKLLCILSIDQIALGLRALDDLRILKAKSKSQVFNTIVPFLSTPNKDELSPGSMRSKSYSPEERDKEIMVETLEKMIEKIKEF